MSISDPNVIDAMAANGDELVLLVTDHFTWAVDQVVHLKYLQNKFNAYIRFIENEGWKEQFGDVTFASYKIEVVFKYPYHSSFVKMIELVRDKLDERKITIAYRVENGE